MNSRREDSEPLQRYLSAHRDPALTIWQQSNTDVYLTDTHPARTDHRGVMNGIHTLCSSHVLPSALQTSSTLSCARRNTHHKQTMSGRI